MITKVRGGCRTDSHKTVGSDPIGRSDLAPSAFAAAERPSHAKPHNIWAIHRVPLRSTSVARTRPRRLTNSDGRSSRSHLPCRPRSQDATSIVPRG